MSVARFVGIGVGEHDKGHLRLDRAVPDVEAVADLLGTSSNARCCATLLSSRRGTA